MTAKTQLNVRISETTRGQLDELAERYGTQATALAVAIDRMHRAKSPEKEDTMSTSTLPGMFPPPNYRDAGWVEAWQYAEANLCTPTQACRRLEDLGYTYQGQDQDSGEWYAPSAANLPPALPKIIVVGRHAGDVPGYQVIERRAIDFTVRSYEVEPLIEKLSEEAYQAGAYLVFQNMPGQVIAAVARCDGRGDIRTPIGVIVSTPGPRPGKVETKIFTQDLTAVVAAVRAANPRAEIDFDMETRNNDRGEVTITVDGPPMPFAFSHIEWLNMTPYRER